MVSYIAGFKSATENMAVIVIDAPVKQIIRICLVLPLRKARVPRII